MPSVLTDWVDLMHPIFVSCVNGIFNVVVDMLAMSCNRVLKGVVLVLRPILYALPGPIMALAAEIPGVSKCQLQGLIL